MLKPIPRQLSPLPFSFSVSFSFFSTSRGFCTHMWVFVRRFPNFRLLLEPAVNNLFAAAKIPAGLGIKTGPGPVPEPWVVLFRAISGPDMYSNSGARRQDPGLHFFRKGLGLGRSCCGSWIGPVMSCHLVTIVCSRRTVVYILVLLAAGS
jgi:hypothetical protein